MPAHASSTAQRFVVLDSFRGLCALSVVIFHLHILDSFTELEFFRSAGLFVEFFFALSGFVLCHCYARQAFDSSRFSSFMISRTCRIFPLHIALLLLYTLLELTKLLVAQLHVADIGPAFAGSNSTKEWLPNLLLLHAWLKDTNAFSFNGPAWSISVEYYIYVAFGLLLLSFSRQRRGVVLLVVLACTICVFANFRFVGNGWFRGITCFFMGALAYDTYQRSREWRIPTWLLSAMEWILLLGIYGCLTWQYPHKSYIATCFFALCIVMFAREGGMVSRFLQKKPFVKLGQWSFSIYLTHYILISLFLLAADYTDFEWINTTMPSNSYLLYLDTGETWGNTLLGLTIIALVLFISSLSYRHIEQRGITLGKRLSQKWLASR